MVLRCSVPFGALLSRIDAAILHGGLGVTSEAVMAGIPVITSGILLLDQRYWSARLEELGVGSEGIPLTELLQSRESNGPSRAVELACKALDQRKSKDCGVVHHSAQASTQVVSHKAPPSGSAGSSLVSGMSSFASVDVLEKVGIRRSKAALDESSWYSNAQALRKQLEKSRQDRDGVTLNATRVFNAGMAAEPVKQAYQQNRGCICILLRQCFCCVVLLNRMLGWILCTWVPDCLRLQLKLVGWLLCCHPIRGCFHACYILFGKKKARSVTLDEADLKQSVLSLPPTDLLLDANASPILRVASKRSASFGDSRRSPFLIRQTSASAAVGRVHDLEKAQLCDPAKGG